MSQKLLIDALYTHDLATASQCAADGVVLSARDAHNAMMSAISQNHPEVLRFLLAIAPHTTHPCVLSPKSMHLGLTSATHDNNQECAEILLDQVASNEMTYKDSDALWNAAYNGNAELVQKILHKMPHCDADDWSVATAAIQQGHVHTVAVLLQHGLLGPNSPNHHHQPLSLAVFNGWMPVVELLLGHGLDPHADPHALAWAVFLQHDAIADVLYPRTDPHQALYLLQEMEKNTSSTTVDVLKARICAAAAQDIHSALGPNIAPVVTKPQKVM